MTHTHNDPGAGDSGAVETALSATARVYANADWYVFPVEPRGKRPMVKWASEATNNPFLVERWWHQWPHANIGIHCGPSGLVVLDVDPRNGGMESLAALPMMLPPTGTVETGGGGLHFYFEGKRRKGKLPGYPGLDIQGDGGYVVAPPSVHPSGREYTWSDDPRYGFLPEFAPWPTELDALASANKVQEMEESSEFARLGPTIGGDGSAYAAAAFRNEVQRVLEAQEGERNDTLNQATFSLWQLVLAGLLDHIKVEDALMRAAMRVGLSRLEARTTIASARIAARPRRGVA